MLLHCLLGEHAGAYVIDSTKLSICHNLRARRPRKSFDERMVGYGYSAKGRVFGDKGCISRKLFRKLCKRGLKLVTSIRRNMLNFLMPLEDKLLLRQRRVIKTMFGRLKEGMRLEHSRHRSATNALVHVVSCLAACILNKKPVGRRGLSQTELEFEPSSWRHFSSSPDQMNARSANVACELPRRELLPEIPLSERLRNTIAFVSQTALSMHRGQ
ncbi:MAG: hypothetical protein OXB95_01960 [Rhodobacteraceae bacterium]|nr:hypothetical protein [Paracoccaceae bacterium]